MRCFRADFSSYSVGATKKNRLAAVAAGDVLLVNDLSRLSRSQDLAPLLARLRHRGVRVIGAQDAFNSDCRTARMQAGLSGIMSEEYRMMIAGRTHSALESRARNGRATGGKCFGYRDGIVLEPEAVIVREMFERYADGASCRRIAAELNAKRVPSPGSSWNRTERRCAGWMGSAIRAMLRNGRYTGAQLWNAYEWVKDPDSGMRKRRARPRSEWITHQDESLRIVPDALFQRAQRSTQLDSDERLKSGGKAKYLLSGLLVCDACGSQYVMADPRSYGCSTHINGRA